MDKLAFGTKLKEARENKKMSREELAEKIDISARAIGQIETGRKSTSLGVMVKICNALDISAECLLAKDIDPNLRNLNSKQEELFQCILKLPENEVNRFLGYIKLTLEHYEEYK